MVARLEAPLDAAVAHRHELQEFVSGRFGDLDSLAHERVFEMRIARSDLERQVLELQPNALERCNNQALEMFLHQGQSSRREVDSLRAFSDVVKFKMDGMAATIHVCARAELAVLRLEVHKRLANLEALADEEADAYSGDEPPESDDASGLDIEQEVASIKTHMISITSPLDQIAATSRYVDGRMQGHGKS